MRSDDLEGCRNPFNRIPSSAARGLQMPPEHGQQAYYPGPDLHSNQPNTDTENDIIQPHDHKSHMYMKYTISQDMSTEHARKKAKLIAIKDRKRILPAKMPWSIQSKAKKGLGVVGTGDGSREGSDTAKDSGAELVVPDPEMQRGRFERRAARLENKKKEEEARLEVQQREADVMRRVRAVNSNTELAEMQEWVRQMQFDKEELIRAHTLETAELRKQVSILTSRVNLATELSMSEAANVRLERLENRKLRQEIEEKNQRLSRLERIVINARH